MGINGLLQQLKSISKPKHVSAYRGQKVAIDGYSWLHKGAYSCSRELCEGIWADGYVRYFVGRVDLLLGNGVVPIVVFDGCRLPMKADEEDNRRRGRREALERARAHAESGNMAAANECYQRAVNITPWMAKVVIEALRERGVRCLVAPYEADAQLSYLALRGEVHAVLTEDSDMLAYGCPRVLYKLDRAGHGEEVLLADLPLVRELNMAGFDHDMLLQMCILAGCDFLPNISGVGIKKAHGLIKKHRDFVRVVRTLRFNGTTVPPNYEVRFQRTLWLFRHQRVFCPAARAMAHLRPLPPGGLGGADVLVAAALPAEGPEREALEFLGPVMEAEVAAGISEGELDPSTLKPFDLATIYRGCPHPPRHLWQALGIPASGPQQHHQQHHQHQRGHGGATPSSSQGGAPSGSQAAAGGSQGAGQGASGSSSQGAAQHMHHHSQQRRHTWGGASNQPGGTHASQHPTQMGHSHRRLSAAGGHGGKPPPAPNGGIQRFFKSNPAASQPFRPVLPGGAVGGGSQARASSDGEGSAPAAVVTLTGQRVQVMPCAAARPAGAEVAASAQASKRPQQHPAAAAAGGLAGDEEPGAELEGGGDEGRSASLGDEAVAAALGGCGVADGYEAADEEQVDVKRSTPNGKRRRRSSDHMRTAVETAGGGDGAGMGAPSPGLLDTISGGSLFARLRCGGAAGGRVGGLAAAGSRGSRPPVGPSTTAAPAANDTEGAAASTLAGAAAGAAAAARLLRVPPAADSAHEGSVSGLMSNFQSQGRSQGLSGADSDAAAGSGYDSQYDSQATAGGEAAASAGGGGSLLGGWGARRHGNRARAPAYLAMEALFSQPSDTDQPASQQQPAGSGPALSLGLRPGAGALPGLDIWRRPPAAGAPSMSQPCMSLPSTSKHSHLTPSPEAAAVEDACAAAAGAAAAGGSSATAAAPDKCAASTAAPAFSSMPQQQTQAPPFSIYDGLDDDGAEDCEARCQPGRGVDAAGRCTGATEEQEDEEAGEDEVTSPWKGATGVLQGSQRPMMAGLRRRRLGAGGGLLHASARRRLNQEEQEEVEAAGAAAVGRTARAGAVPQAAAAAGDWLRGAAAAADDDEHLLFAGLSAARQQHDGASNGHMDGTGGDVGNLFAFVGDEELELGRAAGGGGGGEAIDDGGECGDAEAERLFQALDRKEADRQSLLAELQAAQHDDEQQQQQQQQDIQQQERQDGRETGPTRVGAGGGSGGSGGNGSGGRARRRLLDGFAHAQQQVSAEGAAGATEDTGANAAPPGNTTPFGAYAASAGAAAAPRQDRRSGPSPNCNGAECGSGAGPAATEEEAQAAAEEGAAAAAVQEMEDEDDEDDDVLITQEVAGRGGGGGGFHSVQHVEKFAHLARRAVDRLQLALQPPPAAAAAAAAPWRLREHQQQPPQRRASAAGAAKAAQTGGPTPSQLPHQQQSQRPAPGMRPLAAAQPAGATPWPFGDFTCTRAAPKRRTSAPGSKQGAAARGHGGYFGSVFVSDQGQEPQQQDDCGEATAAEDAGGGQHRHHQQQQHKHQAQAQEPTQGGAGEAQGDGDDDDGEVEIVGMRHTPAMFNRRALAEAHLRQPFQVPRTVNTSQPGSAAGSGAGGGGGGSAVGLTGGRMGGPSRRPGLGGGRASTSGAGAGKEQRQAGQAAAVAGALGLQRFMCGGSGGAAGSRRSTG